MMDNHFREFILSSMQGLFSFCVNNVSDSTISRLSGELSQSLDHSDSTNYIDSPENALSAALAVSSLLDGLGDTTEYISTNVTIDIAKETLVIITSKLGAILRAGQCDRVRGLYVIIDPEVTAGRDPLTIARGAVAGGARVLQLLSLIHI